MKKTPPAKDISAYLRALPRDSRIVLQKLRETIRAAAPQAEEAISYGIPLLKLHGPLVFFAGFEHHCSLFVASKQILRKFEPELRAFRVSGTTIRFTPEHPLPASLVRKIVKAKIAYNLERLSSKRKRRSSLSSRHKKYGGAS